MALTLKEAEARYGVSASTLRTQLHAGRLKGRLVGKTWTVTDGEMARYVAESKGRPGRRPK